MDWEDFEDARKVFVSSHKGEILVAQVTQPTGEPALFGPFATPDEAMDWMLKVPTNVRVRFVPLRRPDKERSHDEFFLPNYMLKDDEYTNNSVTPL